MTEPHAIALLLTALLCLAGPFLAAHSQRVRDAFFVLIVALAVFSERLEANFLSAAWYRGTTRGIEVSLPVILAFGLLAGTLLARRGAGARPRWFWPGSLGLILLYSAYAAISVVTSQPRIFGVFELSKILGGILIFLASALYLRTRREWTILMVVLACVVGFEGAWAIKQKFMDHIGRVSGTLDHPNSLSMYLCLGTPLVVAMACAGWAGGLRWLGIACATLATVALVLTVSRAGIPVFAVVTLGTFFACASWRLRFRTLVFRAVASLAIMGFLAAFWGQIASRYEEASLQEEYLDPRVDGRGIYLRLAKEISAEHFFGVGLNNWSYYVSRDYGRRLGYQFDDYDYLVSVYGTKDVEHVFGDSYLAAPAHNLPALTLGELGIPGLLILVLMWGRWLGMGLPFFRCSRGDPLRVVGLGLFFGICGICGQSLTEWVSRQEPIMITFNVLLGGLASVSHARRARLGQRTVQAPSPVMAQEGCPCA